MPTLQAKRGQEEVAPLQSSLSSLVALAVTIP